MSKFALLLLVFTTACSPPPTHHYLIYVGGSPLEVDATGVTMRAGGCVEAYAADGWGNFTTVAIVCGGVNAVRMTK